MKDNENLTPGNAGKKPLTPHELVLKHSQHPEDPITEAEMNQLDFTIQLTTAKKTI